MSNRIPVVVPCEISQNPYEDRIDLVEKARELVARLENPLDAKFRVGIGRIWEMAEMERSYREALRALNGSLSRVIHIEDLSQNGVYDEAFPGNNEKRMYRFLEEGNEEGMLQEVNFFFDWMVEHYSQDMNNIRLKILELLSGARRLHLSAGRSIMDSVTAEIIWIQQCLFPPMKSFISGFRRKW